MSGYVYFIRAERTKLIKIGYSANPAKRLHDLQMSTGDQLTLLAVMAGSREDERAHHIEFAESRVRGEWFQPSDRLLDRITEIAPANARGALLTAREAMAVLRCCRSFLTDHAAELGATRVGTHLRFPREALAAYLVRQRVPGAVVVEQPAAETPAPRRGRIADLFPPGTINKLSKVPYGAVS